MEKLATQTIRHIQSGESLECHSMIPKNRSISFLQILFAFQFSCFIVTAPCHILNELYFLLLVGLKATDHNQKTSRHLPQPLCITFILPRPLQDKANTNYDCPSYSYLSLSHFLPFLNSFLNSNFQNSEFNLYGFIVYLCKSPPFETGSQVPVSSFLTSSVSHQTGKQNKEMRNDRKISFNTSMLPRKSKREIGFE